MPSPQPLRDQASDADQDYAGLLRAELAQLWLSVVAARAPQVADWIKDDAGKPIPTDRQATPYLQALTIWFQLVRIADENAAIRHRRQTETRDGTDAVPGSFAEAFASTAMTPETLTSLAKRLSVGPTLTAHPTEPKRVTVLEIHRRIYRCLLYTSPSPRDS